MPKKLCFLLFFAAFLLCLPARRAYAVDSIELIGEMGYDGHVDVFLYSSDETRRDVNVVRFFNLDDGITYWTRFDRYNFDQDSKVWSKRVNLPNGDYAVSGGVYLDIRAAFELYTEESNITINGDYGGLICLVGTPEWLEANKFSLEGLTPTPKPVVLQPTVTPEPEALPTFAPAVTVTPEPDEILTETPHKGLGKIILVAVLGAFAVLWIINTVSKRR